MRISDWSSDVCSSDLILTAAAESEQRLAEQADRIAELEQLSGSDDLTGLPNRRAFDAVMARELAVAGRDGHGGTLAFLDLDRFKMINDRTEDHTSELPSLMHTSYAVLCLKKKKTKTN